MFELCRYRVTNLTSCSEFMSESGPVAKNRIEFQWGSKLPGTSLEALLGTTSRIWVMSYFKPVFHFMMISRLKLIGRCTISHQLDLVFQPSVMSFVVDVTTFSIDMLLGPSMDHVLHRPPLSFENWKKVFTELNYTAPNFQNSKKKFIFSLRILIF